MTTPEIPTLAAMLEDLAIRLQAEAYREESAFEALPETTDPKALTERAQQARSIAAKFDYAQAVTSKWLEIEGERQEALRERFAGELVPSDPLALLAMWTTLLTDMDG